MFSSNILFFIVCIIVAVIIFNTILNYPKYKQKQLTKKFYKTVELKSEPVINAHALNANEYYLRLEGSTSDMYIDWVREDIEVLDKPSRVNTYHMSTIKVFLFVTTGKKFSINYINLNEDV